LDENGLEMLENFVRKNGKAFLIVSHDRRFLDRTVTKIIEINNHTKSSKIYGGNYSYFVEQKAADIENQWKEYNDSSTERKN
jgi:ATP-binding cassette subfamily F protein 3